MSKSFHIAIEGNDNAMAFLSSVQKWKTVMYYVPSSGWIEAPVLFIAMTSEEAADAAKDDPNPTPTKRKRRTDNK